MKSASLKEIAQLINGQIVGDENIQIHGLCPIGESNEGMITFCTNKEFATKIGETKASAIIINQELTDLLGDKPGILVKSADYAFALVGEYFLADYPIREKGYKHPSVVIAKTAEVPEDAHLGPNVVIDEFAKIGKNAIIEANSYIGYKVTIGDDFYCYQNVVVREHTQIGNRCILQPGVLVGGDGFGFAFVDMEFKKIPQLGNVVLEDDVEIGANTCIDRARFDKTILRKGVKLDNLIQVGHNVELGSHTVAAAGTGFAGSSKTGMYCQFGGHSGLVAHGHIGNNIRTLPQTAITKDFGDNIDLGGTPAYPADKYRRQIGALRMLPDKMKVITKLERKIKELEERIEKAEGKNESTDSAS